MTSVIGVTLVMAVVMVSIVVLCNTCEDERLMLLGLFGSTWNWIIRLNSSEDICCEQGLLLGRSTLFALKNALHFRVSWELVEELIAGVARFLSNLVLQIST